jgi:hypothetical protein
MDLRCRSGVLDSGFGESRLRSSLGVVHCEGTGSQLDETPCYAGVPPSAKGKVIEEDPPCECFEHGWAGIPNDERQEAFIAYLGGLDYEASRYAIRRRDD